MTAHPPEARHFPATARNREPIRDVLRRHLPAAGTVLEIASGSGEHALYLSGEFPDLVWQPSDPDPINLASIRAWAAAAEPRRPNLLPPLAINASDLVLPLDRADAILCINMVHISPWDATQGLMRAAGRLLPEGGVLYLYGPYRVDRRHTAPSNDAFDRQLRARNETWGVRDLEAVVAEARTHGLVPVETVEMPANNLSVVFRRGA
ncbi:MAG: DUF938 domain-containing protein [Rhodospirillaceae bacterium]